MKATEDPKAPHNQVFNISPNKTNKQSWWNPSSSVYFATKGQKVTKRK